MIRDSSQKGYLLIEVCVSLLLVTFILVLYTNAINIMRLIDFSKYKLIATNVASRKIENLRNIPYDQVTGTGTLTDPELGKLPLGSGSWNVSVHQGDLKQVTVQVNWKENQRDNSIKLETLIGQNGLN